MVRPNWSSWAVTARSSTEPPQGLSAMNIMAGRIVEIAMGDGPEALVKIDCGGATLMSRVTRHSVQALRLEPGKRVFAVVKAVTFDKANIASRAPPAGK